jgi:hypothetical protein
LPPNPQGLPDVLMEAIIQSGFTPEQLQEAMSLLTGRHRAQVPQQPESGPLRLSTWRSAVPYEGTTTVQVVTPSL